MEKLNLSNRPEDQIIIREWENSRLKWGGLDIPLQEFNEHIQKIISSDPLEKGKVLSLKKLHLKDIYLVLGCLKGNEKAWKIFRRCYKNDQKINDLRTAIYKNSCCPLHAEEIYQSNEIESLFYTKNVFRNYQGRCSLRTFIYCVVRNHLALRTEMRLCRKKILQEIDPEREEDIDNLQPLKLQVKNEWIAIIRKTISKVLKELPEENYRLIYEYFGLSLSKRELARRHNNIHESTLGRRLHKILKALKKRFLELIERYGYTEEDIKEHLDSFGKEILLWS